MALVVDASSILSLALDGEEAHYGECVLDAIAADEAFVPTLFWFEIRNALLMGERRKRLTMDRTARFLSDLELLKVVVDDQPRWSTILDLARKHTLSVYDAAYLELAQRKDLSLATIDRALVKAAKSDAIAVFERSP